MSLESAGVKSQSVGRAPSWPRRWLGPELAPTLASTVLRELRLVIPVTNFEGKRNRQLQDYLDKGDAPHRARSSIHRSDRQQRH